MTSDIDLNGVSEASCASIAVIAVSQITLGMTRSLTRFLFAFMISYDIL